MDSDGVKNVPVFKQRFECLRESRKRADMAHHVLAVGIEKRTGAERHADRVVGHMHGAVPFHLVHGSIQQHGFAVETVKGADAECARRFKVRNGLGAFVVTAENIEKRSELGEGVTVLDERSRGGSASVSKKEQEASRKRGDIAILEKKDSHRRCSLVVQALQKEAIGQPLQRGLRGAHRVCPKATR